MKKMMNKLIVLILLIKNFLCDNLLISHKSIDPFQPDMKNFKDIQELIRFPPNMCNIIYEFRRRLLPYEIFTNKFRKSKSKNILDRGLGYFTDKIDFDDIISNGIKARSSLFYLWNLEKLQTEILYEQSEDDKLFEYFDFPEDEEEEDSDIKTFKKNKRTLDWSLFGTYLAKLMYVHDYNNENDHYYCLRNIEVSHLIFKLIYFGYLPGKKAVRTFLKSFLTYFFNIPPNKDSKKTEYIREVYYQLFRSLYSLHLQWFVKLDSSFIALITKIYDKLDDPIVQEFLIDNFIELYLMVMKTLDFAYNIQNGSKTTSDEIKKLFKDLTIKSGIWAVSYGIGFLKSLVPEISGLGKFDDLLGFTGIDDMNSSIKEMLKSFNDKKNHFDERFYTQLMDIKFVINNDDILKIYDRIRAHEENPDKCDICEANLNFNDYFVFETFKQKNIKEDQYII